MKKIVVLFFALILVGCQQKVYYKEVKHEPSPNKREVECSKNRRDYETYPIGYCDRYYNSMMLDTEMICEKHIGGADKTFITKDNSKIKDVIVGQEDEYMRCNASCEDMSQETIDSIVGCDDFKK